MRNDLTDADVLTFTLAGCNPHEVATYAGTSDEVAEVRMSYALRTHGERVDVESK